MSIEQQDRPATPQAATPRTMQLVAGATATHDVGDRRRSARGHRSELCGLSYVLISRLHEGRFGRMDASW